MVFTQRNVHDTSKADHLNGGAATDSCAIAQLAVGVLSLNRFDVEADKLGGLTSAYPVFEVLVPERSA